MDLFQSEADHLSFHSHFIGWKQIGLKELGIPGWLSMMGFNYLLTLEGKTENDRFILLSVNFGQIEQRLGQGNTNKKVFTDEKLLQAATMLASNFGVVKKQEFKTIGGHPVLVLNIGLSQTKSITAINLGYNRRFYSFMLVSSIRNRTANEEHLIETIKSADFQYKLLNETKIKKIDEQFIEKNDPKSILQCVKQLATIGEFNETANKLAILRNILSQRMSKPFIKKNVAYHPAYNIKLLNPNTKKWKLSVQNSGSNAVLLLEDKWSVKEEGIGVIVMDTVLAYGSQAAKAIQTEKMKKELLIGFGRGGANSLGNIESERFTEIKGDLAYEATILTNMAGGIRAKSLSMLRPGFVIGIIMLVDSNTYNTKFDEYDKIIKGDWLQIGGK